MDQLLFLCAWCHTSFMSYAREIEVTIDSAALNDPCEFFPQFKMVGGKVKRISSFCTT